MERVSAWKKYKNKQIKEIESLCKAYKDFLNEGKTERECVKASIKLAEAAGYRNIKEYIEKGKSLTPGDKIYAPNMGKSLALFIIGTENIENGMNILGAHIDSPRLDVKQNPMLEKEGLAYFDTHYYGGIKKYQWAATPLAIHGVVAKTNGEVTEVVIGEDKKGPVVFVSDLLVHLAGEQMDKKAAKAVEGENLDIIVGTKPLSGEEKDAVKANILKILKKKYDMDEADFISAEFELVPAGRARDAGIDESMIMAYGQDDRVCAYTSLAAMLKTDGVKKTACCLLVDKEEIGSVGATGMMSRFFENTVAEIVNLMGDYSEIKLRRCLAASKMLSSDVSAAYDPIYWPYFEKNSSAYMGSGMVFNKFTGVNGKYNSNDANAEYIAKVRKIMEENDISIQTGELGRVDAGGGGTIAYILALYDMEVIDCGVPVLNMHAPYEVTCKADIYETMKGYKAFIKNA